MTYFDCLIVGAGHAGAQAAAALRQNGFAGSLGLIGDEPVAPYDRPALSKDYLAGKRCFERMQLRPHDFWISRQIDLRFGRKAVGVDAAAKRVSCADGSEFAYGALIWAAGGAPRKLGCPGAHLSGVHYIRGKADADALINALPLVSRAVIIGGGYIGLEAAAVLRELGKEITLIESQDRVLARVAGVPVSRFYEAEHRRQGVDIRLGTAIDRIEGADGKATGVRLASGERLAADLVIVGIGIAPSVGPLVAAGAEGDNGLDVDAYCRTSLADVYCVGDCARMVSGRGLRIESVQNANDQAVTAAKAICGSPVAHGATPWFWSDQYNLKLQTIGLNAGYDTTVLRGDPETRSFSLAYLKDGAVIAFDSINAPRDYVQGRKLVELGARIGPDRLADASQPLKALLHVDDRPQATAA